jgi:membrane protease YdiL (CAAX protease family)
MSKISRVTHFLLPILAVLVILAVSWHRLNQADNNSGDPAGVNNLSIISGTAYLFLLAGISGLRIAHLQRSKESAQAFTWLQVIVLAFIAPLLIIWLPDLVVIYVTWTTQQSSPIVFSQEGHPWLPVLQAIALFILLLANGDIHLAVKIPKLSRSTLAEITLWGIGLWLILIFSARLADLFLPIKEAAGLSGSPILVLIATIAGLVLLPVGEEIFFRGRLLAQWQSRFGLTTGGLLTAAIFALAGMRPVLWLPAFLIGIGLNWLAAKGQGLPAPILAHAVINLFVLLILPSILI